MNFLEAVEILGDALEPTKGERRNGWGCEALTIYHAGRHLAGRERIENTKPERPTSTAHSMRWLVKAA